MNYDVLVFIGRFQPFHMGHKSVVDQALTMASTVALVIGSHDQPRDPRNPFTTAERIRMITSVYPNEVANGRIQFVPVADSRYNDHKWIATIQNGVNNIASKVCFPHMAKIGLIGHAKDNTSYYLKSFPMWHDHVAVSNYMGIDATTIRKGYFDHNRMLFDDLIGSIPKAVAQMLLDWEGSKGYSSIQTEQDFLVEYKRQFSFPNADQMLAWFLKTFPEMGTPSPDVLKVMCKFRDDWKSPYPTIFKTVDAVVVVSGHILLVERGAFPGRGLWALPGGYLNPDETLRAAAIRELFEETKIDLPLDTLNRCIRGWREFDDPNRSLRGRTITTAFKFELRNDTVLPKIKGSDDAAKARWVPLSQVQRSRMFEDHYDVISELVGGVE